MAETVTQQQGRGELKALLVYRVRAWNRFISAAYAFLAKGLMVNPFHCDCQESGFCPCSTATQLRRVSLFLSWYRLCCYAA